MIGRVCLQRALSERERTKRRHVLAVHVCRSRRLCPVSRSVSLGAAGVAAPLGQSSHVKFPGLRSHPHFELHSVALEIAQLTG